MVDPSVVSFAGGQAAIFSARCPGKLTDNEDAAALVPADAECGVMAVADGLGGQPAGGSASRIVIESLRGHVGQASEGDRGFLRAAVLDAIEEANRKVLALAVGAGTTVAAAEVRGRLLRVYHVGDSAVLVVGQRGRVKMQTIAHSPVGYALEAGMLDEHEALHHEERHIVSNIVGSPDMRIEVGSEFELAPRDTVLLATDGLFDNLSTGEVIELIRRGPLDAAARRLLVLARERMETPVSGRPSKLDDLTFILFRPSIS